MSHIGEENAYCRKNVWWIFIQWWHKSIAVNRIRCKRTARYGAAPIHKFIYTRNGEKQIHPYASREYGLGLTRHLLNNWLLDYAIKFGAEIQFNTWVKSIVHKDNLFQVNGYTSSNVIIASGANGANNFVNQDKHTILNKQSFGLSAQITGVTSLSTDNVLLLYNKEKMGSTTFGLFQMEIIFGISVSGFKKFQKIAVSQFWFYKEKIVGSLFSEIEFRRKLKGAYCGNYTLFKQTSSGCYVSWRCRRIQFLYNRSRFTSSDHICN